MKNVPNDTLKNHITVMGKTSGGKTYFSKWLFGKCPDYALFWNTQDEQIKAKETDFKNFLYDLLKYKKVSYTPTIDNPLEELEAVQKKLFSFAEQNVSQDRNKNKWLNLFIDEADEYSKTGIYTALDRFAKRGNRYGIKLCSITQRPQYLSKSVITQSTYLIFFNLGSWEREYFKQKGLDIREVEEHLTKKYHFAVYDNVEEKYHLFKPI